ncbi:heat-inducible transcriptional repressor HrcA [Leptolyngbya sp. FACHB-36]|uniref:heat-inducible transcriptional repressor HrcA n=1 Tax=Leptolyngbya sp. FACHB-36 TaxID=2692808 RepID=UPI00168150F9|nr:heat-inducible transcriptional repressor HrcA [Leptolyngbya sp. FACHB-36]MBD2021590.1 heat-inducible transcriptional repressor HrcA [Leptolyngbya sp. FACHB-36]
MSVQVNLTHRQQQVLWATVRHYIATAEPVGSEALVKEYNLSVSSATIRNAMGVLEKVGLLYQPHTSAGRVPSDSGYRIYVDQLITPSNELNLHVEQLLSDRLNRDDRSLEAVLRGAAQILATVSGYIALITTPQTQTAHLRHVQLVPVDSGRVMLIFVTNSYETQSALMELPVADDSSEPDADLLERELQLLSNFLNSELRGRAIAELATLDWSELDRGFQRYGDFLKAILSELTRRSQFPAPTQLLISGLSEVLRQPEFSEVQQVKTIVHLLEEEQDQLVPLIFEQPGFDKPGRRVMIRIGSENLLEPIRTCTLISSTYCKGTTPVGSVGVLGPTRMVYENAIALVEAAADYLSDALS